ncbi:MAG TPA: hypothetical protein EYH30_03865, partial [Anaerolineales bacterium]|nr:hypothetical protein [Anaerolineales bacterium]
GGRWRGITPSSSTTYGMGRSFRRGMPLRSVATTPRPPGGPATWWWMTTLWRVWGGLSPAGMRSGSACGGQRPGRCCLWLMRRATRWAIGRWCRCLVGEPMNHLLLAPRNSHFATYASLMLVALLAAALVWGPGTVNTRGGGDSPFLLQRAHQMLVNLRAGVFPVRWMPDAAYGLGYPFFNYYAAFPYYLVGLLALAGLDLLTALKVVQAVGFVAAALAMYGWVRGVSGGRWTAWLAAVAYTVAPFHLVNVYVRGDSLSEFYAFIFYPLILWALDRMSEVRGTGRWVPASLAYAGMVLTHNISALIFTPFVILYLVIRWLGGELDRRSFVIYHLPLVIGLLLSAWFWLPALAESGLVQLGTVTGGYFHYARHFRAGDLVQRNLLFDYSIAPGGNTPFAMGLVQAACAALGVGALAMRGIRRRLEARWGFMLLGLAVSTVMITPLSKFLWDHLPLLPMVQFPWRFLSVQALFAAAATGGLATIARPIRGLRFWAVALPVALVLVVSALLPLRPDRLPIGPADVTAQRLQLYELFTGNIGTTIRYEYLDRAVVPRPLISETLIDPEAPPRAIPLEGAALEAAMVEREPTRQVWRVWGEGGGIAFPLLYWPGWGAQVDGEQVAVWPVQGSGYLALEVGPGNHIVVLQLGRTRVRAFAESLSLAGLVILLVALIWRRKTPLPVGHWSLIHWSLAIPLLALLLAWLPSPSDAPSTVTDLTMDFDQMPYLHHNPEGVDFGDGLRLMGYVLSTDHPSPGEPLTVTLMWDRIEGGGYTVTLHLVSPAAVRHDVEPLAVSSQSLGGNSQFATHHSLPLPADTPRGIYLIQLRLFGPEGEVFACTVRGRTQGVLYLAPVRVVHGPPTSSDTPLLGPFGPEVRLHRASFAQPAPDRLSVRFLWSAARPIPANYGVSLRLLNGEGGAVATLDTQPGYGFLPTSLWRPGELVADRYLLELPAGLPPGDYRLWLVLYQIPTLEPVGEVRLGPFPLPLASPFEVQPPERVFSLPPLAYSLGVDFGGEVRLAGYGLERAAGALRLTLWWQALEPPQADYTVFVHLFDPSTGEIVAQSDQMPRDGAHPTSWWAAGEVVGETVTLPLDGVEPGVYRLAVGLYDRSQARLQAVGPAGERIPDDRLILPVEIKVKP